MRGIKLGSYTPPINGKFLGYRHVTICDNCKAATFGDHKSYKTACSFCGSENVVVFKDVKQPIYQKENYEDV